MNAPLRLNKLATAKLNLVLGVGLDPELPKLAVRAANVLCGKYINARTGGVAWMSIKRLGDDLGIASESKVREALYALVHRGYLVAERNAGQVTRYTIGPKFFGKAQEHEETEAQPRSRASFPPLGGARSEDAPSHDGAEREPHDGAGTPPRGGAAIPVHLNPDIHNRRLALGRNCHPPPSRRQQGGRELPSVEEARIAEEQFECFWMAYPRHVGKEDARKAFAKALADGAGLPEITLGAKRYAAERHREPDVDKRMRFTAHPATWLNKKRWQDEHPPEPSVASYAPASHGNRRPDFLAIAAESMEGCNG